MQCLYPGTIIYLQNIYLGIKTIQVDQLEAQVRQEQWPTRTTRLHKRQKLSGPLWKISGGLAPLWRPYYLEKATKWFCGVRVSVDYAGQDRILNTAPSPEGLYDAISFFT